MAEFLIFIRNAGVKDASGHWMDAPGIYESLHLKIDSDLVMTAAQKIRKKDILTLKYACRGRPGDVVEVRQDGFFGEPDETTKHGWNHYTYALIKCPPIAYAQARRYMDRLYSGNILLCKNRYSVAALGLVAGEVRVIGKLADLAGVLVDKNG